VVVRSANNCGCVWLCVCVCVWGGYQRHPPLSKERLWLRVVCDAVYGVGNGIFRLGFTSAACEHFVYYVCHTCDSFTSLKTTITSHSRVAIRCTSPRSEICDGTGCRRACRSDTTAPRQVHPCAQTAAVVRLGQRFQIYGGVVSACRIRGPRQRHFHNYTFMPL
jgi:hypothetical protein